MPSVRTMVQIKIKKRGKSESKEGRERREGGMEEGQEGGKKNHSLLITRDTKTHLNRTAFPSITLPLLEAFSLCVPPTVLPISLSHAASCLPKITEQGSSKPACP